MPDDEYVILPLPATPAPTGHQRIRYVDPLQYIQLLQCGHWVQLAFMLDRDAVIECRDHPQPVRTTVARDEHNDTPANLILWEYAR